MELIPFVFIALAGVHTSSAADGVHLKNPISLAVLGADMYALERTFPSPGYWLGNRVINYNDEVKFVVNLSPKAALGQTVLELEGQCTVAKPTDAGSPQLNLFKVVPTLLYHNGLFYFEDPTSEAVETPQDYYIVHYEPPEGTTDKDPIIRYMPKDQFESRLLESIRGIAHEMTMSGGEEINTYFFMNGRRVQATYFKESSTVLFKANFFFIYSSSETELVDKSIRYGSMTYDLSKVFSPELSSHGTVYGVRLTSTYSNQKSGPIGNGRITRQLLLKDVQQSTPPYQARSVGATGMIKYGTGRMFTVNHYEINQRQVLRIAGLFLTESGDPLCCICIATPEVEPGTGNILSEETVIFSCPLENSGNVRIMLREDTDSIMLRGGYSVVRNFHNPYRIEPYLEYLSHEQLVGTLRRVSDVMRVRCANGFHRQSYRLHVNVFLVYDCKTGIAWFDRLDLWLRSDQEESLFVESLAGVTYDSKSQRFLLNGEVLTSFKLRQPHTTHPQVPPEQQYKYPIFLGGVTAAIDLKSVEWDLYKIRRTAVNNVLPSAFGLVSVSDAVLFKAEKSQEIVDGVKKWVATAKGFSDSCIPNGCLETFDILYDGSTSTVANRKTVQEVPDDGVLTKVAHMTMFNDVQSVGNHEKYVELSKFRDVLIHYSKMLERTCTQLGKIKYADKLNIYLYLTKGTTPTSGSYDCELGYIYFFSDFKAMTYPSQGQASMYQLGEELTIIPDSEGLSNNETPIDSLESSDDPAENDMRKMYSNYIVRDLIYEKRDQTFHSRSMFLSEVFALRLLPGKSIDEAYVKSGRILKHLDTRVYIHRANVKSAKM